MKEMVFYSVILSIFLIVLMPLSSSEIIISQPSSLYNLGEDFSVTLSLNPVNDINDFLIGKIVCNNGEVEIYKSSHNVKASEGKNLSIGAKIDRSLIGDIDGYCSFHAKFGSEEAKSQDFEISRKINNNIYIANSIVSPGEKFTISGTAKKINGQTVQGFIEAYIPGTNLSIMSTISNGEFNFDFILPINFAAGHYVVEVKAYEKESSGVTANEGMASASIKVKQIINKIDVAIDSQSVNPGNNLSYKVLLYDQTNNEARLNANVIIYDSKNGIFTKKLIIAGDIDSFLLPLEASPGYWTIEGNYEDITFKRYFYIEEVQKISYELENQTLLIKNAGNVPYKKSVEISIGDGKEIKKLNLEVGESKKFKLFAPDGSYTISIRESELSQGLGNSYLTGNAIGIKEIEILSDNKIMIWVWIVLLLVLAAIAFHYYMKVRRKSYTEKTSTSSNASLFKFSPDTKYLPYEEVEKTKDAPKKLENRTQTPISYGAKENSKEEVAVIVLKVKNISKLRDSESSAFLTIEHVLQKARNVKARVYDQGAFKIIVLAPRITKSSDNNADTVKLAHQINLMLNEFNKKYAIKIEYGIGVNNGEMFIELIEGKPKFTSVGNTIVLAKNAAEKADSELLLSPTFYRKVYNIVKAEQTINRLHKVNSIIERDKHSEFIQKFMKKQKND